ALLPRPRRAVLERHRNGLARARRRRRGGGDAPRRRQAAERRRVPHGCARRARARVHEEVAGERTIIAATRPLSARRAHGRRRHPERAGARALGAPPRPLAAPRLRRRVDGAAGTRARLLSDPREKFYPELPAIRFAIYDVLSETAPDSCTVSPSRIRSAGPHPHVDGWAVRVDDPPMK